GAPRDSIAIGITLYEADPQDSPAEICVRFSEKLKAYHGEFAHDPPWSEIEVYGVSLSPELESVFRELGATAFESTIDGFICRRSTAG
ncbi:MAG TPA: hypothetical protein PKD61_34010, partial [Polyangiaceae bacterium]|nr:hypothetical protein [Polyangiaceae bacterium]